MNGAIRSPALLLSTAFGIIGMSVGINALVKSNDLKSFVKSHAPTGVTVNLTTHDIFDSGVVVTVGSALLALTSAITLLFTVFRPHSRKPHRISSLLHFFWALWIFASLVAYDVIARNRQAKVTAFLGGSQLPDSIVQAQEQALGVTPVYWNHHYLRLLAILPWFAFLFGVIAGVALLHASNTASNTTHLSRDAAAAGVGETDRDEKEARRNEVEPEKMSSEKRDSVYMRDNV